MNINKCKFLYKQGINNICVYFSGGGSYDNEGNQRKIGQWIDLDEEFNVRKQVTYNGEYNMNGMKVGQWCILFKSEDEYEQMQIFHKNKQYHFSGGGSYDQEGSQKKIGLWIDLDEGFNFRKQVTYNGEYNMNGMKVGQWCILFKSEDEYEQIGGGSYDQEGGQIKIGQWIDLDVGFFVSQLSSKQIIYKGEYNMNGIKIGRWNIMYCRTGEQEYQQMQILKKYEESNNYLFVDFSGGGSYDQEGSQKKVGKWVELDEDFSCSQQVTYNGEYNMKGIKIGFVNGIKMYIKECKYYVIKEYTNMCFFSGGGAYDQEGGQKKIGKWIELDENFQVTFNGEYNMKGMKVGIWVEMDLEKLKKYGEKKYEN
ncbi:unnamed protein product [Paramecium sonneborni]|uniref:Uncharacterized protein n=1 Tax=Paramecium sonneborni TaxID=65129 RepID=A0A8S1RNZ0_9CILI|nr:unnamed protein product [Paramecium sonneborni]